MNYVRKTRWMQGTYAQVYVPVSAEGSRTGELALRVAKPPGVPARQLAVYVEGIEFCKYGLTDNLDEYMCRFVLPDAAARQHAGHGLRIEFRLSDAPAGEPGDPYPYAAEFESVELR